MKILKNAGAFEVLTKTEDIVTAIATAARTCYQSQDKASPENDIKLLKNIINRNHTPMLEFADMTVRFDLVSRGFTHEDVRHRLCSFAQESTRYVDESDFLVVVPPHKDENEKCVQIYHENSDGKMDQFNMSLSQWFDVNEQAYKSLRKNGWKPEDARQVLPTAIKSQIVHKANMAEWRHIFFRRCDKFAHWEIRKVMLDLLSYCKQNIPIIFDDFHFFNTEDGSIYARPVKTEFQLSEEIRHFILAHIDDEPELLDNMIAKIKATKQ